MAALTLHTMAENKSNYRKSIRGPSVRVGQLGHSARSTGVTRSAQVDHTGKINSRFIAAHAAALNPSAAADYTCVWKLLREIVASRFTGLGRSRGAVAAEVMYTRGGPFPPATGPSNDQLAPFS